MTGMDRTNAQMQDWVAELVGETPSTSNLRLRTQNNAKTFAGRWAKSRNKLISQIHSGQLTHGIDFQLTRHLKQ